MAKTLTQNVYDHATEKWYGPAYGNADQAPDSIGAHAYAPVDDGTDVVASEAGQVGPPDAQPVPPKALADMSKDELVAEAETRGVDSSGTKADLLARLNG